MAQDILQQRQQLSQSYQDPNNALYDPNYNPANDYLLNNSNAGGFNTAEAAANLTPPQATYQNSVQPSLTIGSEQLNQTPYVNPFSNIQSPNLPPEPAAPQSLTDIFTQLKGQINSTLPADQEAAIRQQVQAEFAQQFQDQNRINDIRNQLFAAGRAQSGDLGFGASDLARNGIVTTAQEGANQLARLTALQNAEAQKRIQAQQSTNVAQQQDLLKQAQTLRDAQVAEFQAYFNNQLAKQKADREAALANELTLSSGQTIYDRTTGQPLFSAPSADKFSTVPQGSVLIDQKTGQPIFTNPAKAALPPSAQEYEYAKANGYKGTYTDYQNEDANRKRTITNNIFGGANPSNLDSNGQYKTDLDALIGTVPNIIQSANGKVAFAQSIKRARNDADKINAVATVVLRNAPAGVRNDVASKSAAVSNVDKAIALLDSGVKTGLINNAKQYVYNAAGKDYDPKLAAVGAYITAALQPYRNSITGAVWGEQENAEYEMLFGSTKYSPAELKDRLLRVKGIMKDFTASTLQSQVGLYSDYNPFSQPSTTAPGATRVINGATYVKVNGGWQKQ